MSPETHYAKSGDVSIAYQVTGEGPIDLVYVPGWVSHLELSWEEPEFAHELGRLASFSRLIRFDKRGTGLSDRVTEEDLPTLEERMDDVRAVMDASASDRAALFGTSEGGPMCALFAATYPDRTSALILYGSYAKRLRAPDYPWGQSEERYQEYLDLFNEVFGGPVDLEARAPSTVIDERFKEWWSRMVRTSVSPSALRALHRMNGQIDIRGILPSIRVPTLVLHRSHDRLIDVENGRFLAAHIPGAVYRELPGVDHIPWAGDQDSIVDEIQEFLTGVRPPPDQHDRVLATVLFTDIAGSTSVAARLGDRRWRDVLERHHQVVRAKLEQFGGGEVDTAGDGFFATFQGPARAIRCACAIRDSVRPLGIEIRAGLHTGECELMTDKVGGIAVHTGARVAGEAKAGEVLVSSTVKDLVAGSGIVFADRGERELKGVGAWRVYSVVDV